MYHKFLIALPIAFLIVPPLTINATEDVTPIIHLKQYEEKEYVPISANQLLPEAGLDKIIKFRDTDDTINLHLQILKLEKENQDLQNKNDNLIQQNENIKYKYEELKKI